MQCLKRVGIDHPLERAAKESQNDSAADRGRPLRTLTTQVAEEQTSRQQKKRYESVVNQTDSDPFLMELC